MDERAVIEILSSERRDPTAFFIRRLLECVEPAYWLATSLRNRAYRYRLKQAHHLPVPVLSVGNITTGGTGKTPVVAWLGSQLQPEYQVGLLSRGYRELGEEGNDEFKVLKTVLPDVPHRQQRDRVSAGKALIEQYGVNCLILDDGFQHRRLARNVDLVLIDATNPFGFGHCLPRGLLRESLTGLQRASGFLITRADLVAESQLQHIESQLQRYSCAPVWRTCFQPTGLINAVGERIVRDQFTSLSESVGISFCGLGNPAAFQQTLLQGGLMVQGGLADEKAPFKAFPDHHHYTETDWQEIEQSLDSTGPERIGLTTMKDLVKLPKGHPLGQRLWALEIELTFASQSEQQECLAYLQGLLSQ